MAEKPKASAKRAYDTFEFAADDPLREQHELLARLLDELHAVSQSGAYLDGDPTRTEAGRTIAGLSREEQALVVAALIPRLEKADRWDEKFEGERTSTAALRRLQEVWWGRVHLSTQLEYLVRRKLPLSPETCEALIAWIAYRKRFSYAAFPVRAAVAAAEELVQARGLTDAVRALVAALIARIDAPQYHDKKVTALGERLEALLGKPAPPPLEPGSAWAETALADLASLPPAEQAVWNRLLEHCRKAEGATPGRKWLQEALSLQAAIGEEKFRHCILRWFSVVHQKPQQSRVTAREWADRCAMAVLTRHFTEIVDAARRADADEGPFKVWPRLHELLHSSADPWRYLQTFQHQSEVRAFFAGAPPALTVPPGMPPFDPLEDKLLPEAHMDILRALAWLAGQREDPQVARALTALAISAYSKIPGRGPRAVRVGNGCVTALGMMPGLDAVAQLALLKVKVKFGGAQQAIEKALTASAQRSGLPREELEEMSVPAYGLTELGRRTEQLGEFVAELEIGGTREVALTWRRPDGKEQKSLPAAVKQEFAEDVKELTAAKKEIEKMLPAQAERIESLYLERKDWPLETWLERYFEHPFVGTLARRLIWNFTDGATTTPGICVDGKLVDRLGRPIALNASPTRVSLWHPLHQPAEMVRGWRGFLEEWQIRQPFKQAHREVYVLTPAEERTGIYSNRFAAHILKQHQFNALCSARKWKNQLRLIYGKATSPPSRVLPHWSVRAEFWVEGLATGAKEDANETGTYLYVSTDQVRFYAIAPPPGQERTGENLWPGRVGETLELAEIPPIVFSEIMRDVDLFVGVASVGNDPNWADAGRDEIQRNYWHTVSFGELSATAHTRRELLERLIPKLKIAAQCRFEERFLVVQGELRRYKIHLGSGNILMSPNDQYLCIVPRQTVEPPTGKVFLPFEGDQMLSVILSKAFLLAADARITDATIARQIRG